MNFARTSQPGAAGNVARSPQTPQRWPWLDTLRTLRLRFREDRLGLVAASLTFTTLISLVPLLTVMLAVFSAFPMFASFQDSLQKYFLQRLVPPGIAGPVLDALNQFASKASQLGAVGLVVLVLTALALMLTIDRTLGGIWRVRAPRPIAQRVLVYWTAMTLGPLVLGVSLSLTSYAVSASRGLVAVMPGGVGLLLGVLEFVLLACGLAGLFHHVPNTPVRWRHAVAGGVFAAAGIEVAKKGLGWYLTLVPTYSIIYGAFATLPIFLIWIYLGWVIVLLGAVIAAYAPSLGARNRGWPDGPGSAFRLAVAVLRQLAEARSHGAGGNDATQVAESLQADPWQTGPLLQVLVDLDWAGRLDEGDNPRYVLICEPAATPAGPLVERLLVEASSDLAGFWRVAGFGEMTVADLVGASNDTLAPTLVRTRERAGVRALWMPPN